MTVCSTLQCTVQRLHDHIGNIYRFTTWNWKLRNAAGDRQRFGEQIASFIQD
jgi:hypothetical protein